MISGGGIMPNHRLGTILIDPKGRASINNWKTYRKLSPEAKIRVIRDLMRELADMHVWAKGEKDGTIHDHRAASASSTAPSWRR